MAADPVRRFLQLQIRHIHFAAQPAQLEQLKQNEISLNRTVVIVLVSFIALGFAWLIHLALWRVRLPKSQLKALLIIFISIWVLAVVFSAMSGWRAAGAIDFAYFSMIYWPAALCYMITYPAIEGDSPTLSLTRHLHRRGKEGISHEEIEEFFRQRPFVGARIKALVTDQIFVEETGGYRLAPGKYLFFRLILGYRRIVFGPIKSGG